MPTAARMMLPRCAESWAEIWPASRRKSGPALTELGGDALWITPPVGQIHGATDEGTGKSYGFHGYWARDFTAIDASLGTEADMHALVDAAHPTGIRVLLDVVVNHTGPVTAQDPVWPGAWVRTGPACTYRDFKSTATCTLVANLPDIRTESDAPVALPSALVAKWKREGRYKREVSELDAFFKRTAFADWKKRIRRTRLAIRRSS